MTGVIFLIQGEKLVELREEEYNSEDLFQKLLADYPKILAGDQIDSNNPRKWLLIAREMGVPDNKDALSRWSLDHLFIDQDGIPTFVEVKRSTDTRARREVVAQMLDYAANGVAYWNVSELKVQFEKYCADQGKIPEDVLHDALGIDIDYEHTWKLVSENLQNGKVRLLFVADEIPNELKRIVEFLNEKMTDVEVLAVEVKQFTGETLKTLVPRVIGQTSQAEVKKERLQSKNWDRESFLMDLESRKGKSERIVMEKIFAWFGSKGIEFSFGRGKQYGSVYPHIFIGEDEYTIPLSIDSVGSVSVNYMNLKKCPAFQEDKKRRELVLRLNKIPGINLPKDIIENWRNFSLSALTKEENLKLFFDVFDEVKKNLES